MTLTWTEHKGSGNLAAATREGLYTITRGGENKRQFVLRYLPLSSANARAEVLGIHNECVHAKDEAERHNKEHHNHG